MHIVVIGAGPAGLMVAERVAGAGHTVTLFDAMPSPARKFLMAGRGGLNLTHSEALERFRTRYGAAAGTVAGWLARFSPQDLRDWADGLGVPTFIGSSGRVFPESFKASVLLRAWLGRLAGLGVTLKSRHRWLGWGDEGALRFAAPEGEISVRADAVVLALGGASWPRLGSDGGWTGLLAARGVAMAPFQPANMGVEIAWSPAFADRAAGQPLKRIALSYAGRTVRGEAVLTRSGMEGGAVYALSAALRDGLAAGPVDLLVDFKPDMTLAAVAQALARTAPAESTKNRLRKALNLDGIVPSLLREAAPPGGGDGALPVAGHQMPLAALVKRLPLRLTGVRGLERAISSAGGVALSAVDERLMLRALPGVFACGEMLDWEAPTGGYLLQACFSGAVVCADGVLDWLGGHQPQTDAGATAADGGQGPAAGDDGQHRG